MPVEKVRRLFFLYNLKSIFALMLEKFRVSIEFVLMNLELFPFRMSY